MVSSRELTVSIKRALGVLATSGTLLIPSERRIDTGDSLKSGMGVENKRHTNVHQPLTSQSPIGATMPQIIREMIVLLRSEATQYAVSARTELDADLPQVMGDRVQLQQVLMNLMMNSIDGPAD